MESILTSIKTLLGLDEDTEDFDTDIIMHINSVFLILNQLGVGTSDVFSIQDKYSSWEDFIPDGNYKAVKSYMYLKVKLLFDPPLTSAVMEAMERQIKEYEWRLNVSADTNQNG